MQQTAEADAAPMSSLPGRAAGTIAMGALAFAASAAAQFLTPNSTFVVPPRGQGHVEAEFYVYRVDEFVDMNGGAQTFPNHLYFNLGVLRASYAPFSHVAFGALLPYRWTSFAESEGEPALTSHGSPGFGVFADWSPASVDDQRLIPTVRVGYFRARTDDSPGVTISDGYSRYSAVFDLASVPASRGGWRGDGNLYLAYAPTVAGQERQTESRLELAGGRRVVAVGSTEICLLAVMGYGAARSAIEEGVYFHDRESRKGFAGVRLDWQPLRSSAPPWAVRFSVVSDVLPINALTGWRAAVSFSTGF